MARGTLAPREGMKEELPPLREPPLLTMADMEWSTGTRAGTAWITAPPEPHT